MDYLDMFNMFEISSDENPYQRPNDIFGPSSREPQLVDSPANWEETFKGFKSSPVLYNMDGYISPYASQNWGGTSRILQYIDDDVKMGSVNNKIDPNRIFSSEINGLRALAADQQKITKLFEKRLMESLTEKGKIGLTEEDVEAMSALTSARATIASISKEQVNIKKNIADLKIKQNQSTGTGGTGSSTSTDKSVGSSMDIGRSILDNIFNAPSTPTTPVMYNASATSDASKVIDELVPSVNNNIAYENTEPTTYVMLGDTDDDVEYATYSSNGDLLPDFNNPSGKITNIDRDSKTATNEYLEQFPIKFK